MTEGTYAIEQRNLLLQDLDEMRLNIEKVVLYVDSLPDDPMNEAIRLRIKTLLNIGEPVVLDPEDQLEIFSVDMAEEQDTSDQLSLVDWGKKVAVTFNGMTTEDSDGLRRMAARENLSEEKSDGNVHESEAPGDG